MATIVHRPDGHSCLRELEELGRYTVGTVAECSCGLQFVMEVGQTESYYWGRALTRYGLAPDR